MTPLENAQEKEADEEQILHIIKRKKRKTAVTMHNRAILRRQHAYSFTC
jgi:hypothetical protein